MSKKDKPIHPSILEAGDQGSKLAQEHIAASRKGLGEAAAGKKVTPVCAGNGAGGSSAPFFEKPPAPRKG